MTRWILVQLCCRSRQCVVEKCPMLDWRMEIGKSGLKGCCCRSDDRVVCLSILKIRWMVIERASTDITGKSSVRPLYCSM